ncbi:hypothetical protein [Kutzneria sp. NPDC051319]|uniref:hypothetical protein n=1 Tax=Kutzneria sp. NPDC051319 TaxID=3155047 RepID=UPI00344697C4
MSIDRDTLASAATASARRIVELLIDHDPEVTGYPIGDVLRGLTSEQQALTTALSNYPAVLDSAEVDGRPEPLAEPLATLVSLVARVLVTYHGMDTVRESKFGRLVSDHRALLIAAYAIVRVFDDEQNPKKWPYTPQQCLRTAGPARWLAARQRAIEIADHDRDFTQRIEPWHAIDLLAIMIYGAEGPADEVDLQKLVDQITPAIEEPARPQSSDEPEAPNMDAATADFHTREQVLTKRRAQPRTRLVQLHDDLSDTLEDAGHTMRARAGSDPVIDAWRWLDIEPVNNGEAFSEFPAWMVHPRGSTALGRQLPIVREWLNAAL